MPNTNLGTGMRAGIASVTTPKRCNKLHDCNSMMNTAAPSTPATTTASSSTSSAVTTPATSISVPASTHTPTMSPARSNDVSTVLPINDLEMALGSYNTSRYQPTNVLAPSTNESAVLSSYWEAVQLLYFVAIIGGSVLVAGYLPWNGSTTRLVQVMVYKELQ